MKKKLIGIILIAAIICSIFAPSVVATNCNTSSIPANYTGMTYKDNNDGTTLISHFVDGQLVASALADPQEYSVFTTLYDEQGNITLQRQTYHYPTETSVMPLSTGTYYVGKIIYSNHTINFYYDSFYNLNSHYELGGEYADFAVLVGVLVSMVGWPGLIAEEVAAGILSTFGISLSVAGMFNIPSGTTLDCVETRFEWNLVDDDIVSICTSFSGSFYQVTSKKPNQEWIYTGEAYVTEDYYHPSLFSKRDTDFAEEMYVRLYNRTCPGVISWVDGG